MGDDVPEYYQSLLDEGAATTSPGSPGADSKRAHRGADKSEPTPQLYRADGFQITLPSDEWCDRSTYTFQGPRVDGLSHNVTITVTDSTNAITLSAFAAEQVDHLLVELDDSSILMDDVIALHCGTSAHRVILAWQPPFGRRLYQEQLYVLHDGRGFTLTASFTRKSRKQLGEAVEQVMLGFNPVEHGSYGRT